MPLKAALPDVSANFKCFGAHGDQRLNFDGYIYIHYASSPYSARISFIYLLPFSKVWLDGWAPFADLRVRRLATNHTERRILMTKGG